MLDKNNKIPEYCKVFISEIDTFSFFIKTSEKSVKIGDETFFLGENDVLYRNFQGRMIVVRVDTMEIRKPNLSFFHNRRIIPITLSDFGNGFNVYL